jgi:hypothetical protein
MRPSRRTSNRFFFSDFEHANLGVADCIREVVHIDWFHVRFPLLEIQMLDVVLLSLVDVDGFRVNSANGSATRASCIRVAGTGTGSTSGVYVYVMSRCTHLGFVVDDQVWMLCSASDQLITTQ